MNRLALLLVYVTLQVAAPFARSEEEPLNAASDLQLATIAKSKPLAYSLVTTIQPTDSQIEALEATLAEYRKSGKSADFTGLLKFLETGGAEPFRLWITASMAKQSYDAGLYSKSIELYESCWEEYKGRKLESKARDLVNLVGVDFAGLCSRLGRKAELESLLTELEGRPMRGAATEKRIAASQALALMVDEPERSFNCGPFALASIRAWKGLSDKGDQVISKAKASARGFSLTQVQQLAAEAGMDWKMAYREPGSGWIMPSVIHWKADHYAAILSESNGRFRVKDPTFLRDVRLSEDSIDEESSGYFLVAADSRLPEGWRWVAEEEGSRIHGKGAPTGQDPRNDGKTPDCFDSEGMASYSVDPFKAAAVIRDTPLFYSPPVGPSMAFSFTYFQGSDSPTGVGALHSNVGFKWSMNWFSWLQEIGSSDDVEIYLPDGRKETHHYDSGESEYLRHAYSGTQVVAITGGYRRTLPNGSYLEYARAESGVTPATKYFLSAVSDSFGNTVTLDYDGSDRLIELTDAMGDQVDLTYADPNDDYLLTGIADSFGRTATIAYDSEGRLTSITDMAGLVSSFVYRDPVNTDFVTRMTTPYGATDFRAIVGGIQGQRFLEITDPEGLRERYHYRHRFENWALAGVQAAHPRATLSDEVPSSVTVESWYMDGPVTLFWPKNVVKNYNPDSNPDKATQIKWCRASDNQLLSVPIKDNERSPLTHRVWYRYPSDLVSGHHLAGDWAGPSVIVRRIENESGTPSDQKTQVFYNDQGLTTKTIDPLGRETTYEYDTNDIDLLAVKQKNGGGTDTLSTFGYPTNPADPVYGKHVPTSVTDAGGNVTTMSFNAAGQPTLTVDPEGSQTRYIYDEDLDTNPDDSGYLIRIEATDPADPMDWVIVTAITYDAKRRIDTVTDQSGYTVSYDYDNLDRLTVVTHPDGTTEETKFESGLLQPSETIDRNGLSTTFHYNGNRQVTGVVDPEGRLTAFQWCACGNLKSFVDPEGRTTKFMRDLMGRVYEKHLPDGSVYKTSYKDDSGKVETTTTPNDAALTQVTATYSHYLDGSLAEVDYTDAGTPDVSYVWDSVYRRLDSRTDGAGAWEYSYYPVDGSTNGAGQLSEIDGPLDDDIVAMIYDDLGRVTRREIRNDDTSVRSFVDTDYDELGRVKQITDDRGDADFNYDDATGLLESVELPNGQITNYSYTANVDGRFLEQIENLSTDGTTNLSTFDYVYDDSGRIKEWWRTQGSGATDFYKFVYRRSGELSKADRFTAGGAPISTATYGYDRAGNRLSEMIDGTPVTWTVNDGNQLTDGSQSGPARIIGTIDEPATVTVNGLAAIVTERPGVPGEYLFESLQTLETDGLTDIEVVATDASSNTSTENLTIETSTDDLWDFAYDDNGNMLERTSEPGGAGEETLEFGWDAENRLIEINDGTDVYEFMYDAAGLRVAQRKNSTMIRQYVWAGGRIVEERDGSGDLLRTYYPFGITIEQSGDTLPSGEHYFAFDHLGSIREVVSASGTLGARYDYDPWGRRERVAGTGDLEIGFSGHVHHGTGLIFAPFRAYDPDLGRWLSRDPISESGGPNLYGYVENDPVNYWDPQGLQSVDSPTATLEAAIVQGNFTQARASLETLKLLGNISDEAAAALESAILNGEAAAAAASRKAVENALRELFRKCARAKEKELIEAWGKENIHKVKELIRKQFEKELRNNKNFDVWLDKAGNVVLKGNKTGTIVPTNLPLRAFAP